MNLAKSRIDIGLYTNNAQPLLEFWRNEIQLPFDHLLPVRKGQKQHRFDLLGSVLKINELAAPILERPPSGYCELLIARKGVVETRPLADPEGNLVKLVTVGMHGIARIGIRIEVNNVEAHRRFYIDALGLPEGPTAGRAATFLAGDTVLFVEHSPKLRSCSGLEGKGWRYITFQVFEVDREHECVLQHGGRELLAPVTLGTTARISLVSDPDGNVIELSQRASLTGSLEVKCRPV
ncbi:VOC family protein [Bradyrhizobium elkanii]|uniref:VOC family protein n=1 Tax=Bradyrhizobium elkanii TaxID=29448 RepID=UPI0004B4CE5C|nr:VOC family protein [Bradyrhizobium elkanii]WLA83285.1 VOC family protein [Bradyrhizobium elkanii]